VEEGWRGITEIWVTKYFLKNLPIFLKYHHPHITAHCIELLHGLSPTARGVQKVMATTQGMMGDMIAAGREEHFTLMSGQGRMGGMGRVEGGTCERNQSPLSPSPSPDQGPLLPPLSLPPQPHHHHHRCCCCPNAVKRVPYCSGHSSREPIPSTRLITLPLPIYSLSLAALNRHTYNTNTCTR